MQQLMEHEDFMEMENEDFLELEHEDFLELEQEHEDFMELEQEHEDFLELEQEHEDFMELEHEDFLGALGSIASSIFGGELEASPLGEVAEMEFASELLEVNSEQELEQFLGKLIKGAARGVSNFAKSSTGKALGGVLKNLAKKALPVVGGALGSLVAPGVGTAIGSKLGGLAGGLFELESEMTNEQAEFEVARRIVRIGTTAARNAAQQSARGVPPVPAARRAVVAATRAHAPAALPSRLRGPNGRFVSANNFRGRRPAYSTTGRAVRRPGTRPVSSRSVGRPRTRAVGRPIGVRPNGQVVRAGVPRRGIVSPRSTGGFSPSLNIGYSPTFNGGAYRPNYDGPGYGGGFGGGLAGGYSGGFDSGFGGSATRSGRWIREGRSIVLLDV